MRKLLGSLCIMMGGFALRWMQLQKRRNALNTLLAFLQVLRSIEEEIRMTRTPLPVLFEKHIKTICPEISSFMRAFLQDLQAGKSLGDAWTSNVLQLPLPEECKSALDELGQGLRGDEPAVTGAFQLAVKRLEQIGTQMERRRNLEERQITAWTLSGASLLIVLLI